LKAEQESGEYITVIDLSKEDHGFGGAQEVIGYSKQEDEAGEGADLIVLDWFGAMVDRNAYSNPKINADNRYQSLAPNFIDELATYCREVDKAVLMLHQLTTEACAKPPGRKPSKTDAYMFRAFSYFMDSCSCLGTMTKDRQVCWFVPDKSRRSSVQDTKIKLFGNLQKFVDVEAEYTCDKRNRFKKVDEEPEDAEEKIREKY